MNEGLPKKGGPELESLEKREREREKAMGSVIDALDEKLKEPMKYEFSAGGGTHPLTCEEDCLVADAQHAKQAAKSVLEDVRNENDYRKEQAAAQLVAMFEAHESLSSRFAEIHQSSPESAEKLSLRFPAFVALKHTGEKVWGKVKDSV